LLDVFSVSTAIVALFVRRDRCSLISRSFTPERLQHVRVHEERLPRRTHARARRGAVPRRGGRGSGPRRSWRRRDCVRRVRLHSPTSCPSVSRSMGVCRLRTNTN